MATDIDTGLNMMNSYAMYPDMAPVYDEPRVGENVITQGLTKDLEEFYDKTESSADREKALQLLTSLKFGQEIKHPNYPPLERPHTAMPTYGGRNPYQTTYTKDYPFKESSVTAIRPMSSQGFAASHDLSGPIGATTYHNDFSSAPQRPASPVRSGTASGSRNNKPHPLQSFMVWKFPSKARAEQKESPWSEELTDDMIKQVHKRLCQSTYQSDFLGIPQGFQVKSAYNLPPDWKANIPYTLDSVARYSFQTPSQQDELKLPASRYGSNKKKQFVASGTIPTASSRYMHIKQRTTYDRHYNDNSPAVVTQIKDTGKKLGTEALRKHMEKTEGEEKDLVGKMLEAYEMGGYEPMGGVPNVQPPPPRPNSRASVNSKRSYKPPSTPISNFSANSSGVHPFRMGRTPTPSHRSPSTPSCGRPDSGYQNRLGMHIPPTPISLPMKGSRTPSTPISVPYTPPMFLS
ncbi:uncharacterized protein LOC132565305 [Ylistrum balloti]|uniref:uncharacterized protein LOC132565305 n=1 Tax=Ylistrum balloti TaxID=509963 RepID=UPI00290590F8|nr:uncharacterized protein LOC132565305 [Ylistrum balloti]